MHKTGGAQHPATARRSACAPGTLQCEFENIEAFTFQARAQRAIAEIYAIDHRTQRQVVGAQVSTPQGASAGAGQCGIGVQRATQAPAGWRQH